MVCSPFILGDATVTSLELHYKKSRDSSFLVQEVSGDCSNSVLFGLLLATEYTVKLKLFTDLTPLGNLSTEVNFTTGKNLLCFAVTA